MHSIASMFTGGIIINAKDRKFINFDLDDKALRAAYPKASYKQAWGDIQKFMLKNGFEHRQFSGYTSVQPMSKLKVSRLFSKMRKELPWLNEDNVIKEIDVSNIGDTFSYKHMFNKKYIVREKDITIN